MQKFLAIACILVCSQINSFGQNRNWDKPMQLKNCNIEITTDAFTATTLIEMEFYNPNEQEIEGLQRFQLLPGQAITGFQLDLNGKYRCGSIEEKGKAANAYNTIVGKRIDPAILQMDSYNNYSLRIYPIAPKKTRKITMTIQQVLQVKDNHLVYHLPLMFNDVVSSLHVMASVFNADSRPLIREGLLLGQHFSGKFSGQKLHYDASEIKLDKPLAFLIPLQKINACTKNKDGQNYFAVRAIPEFKRFYPVSPRKLTVYWDVSASGSKRNTAREISFLKQYVSFHKISMLEIISFNYRIIDRKTFPINEQGGWLSYLRSFDYDGATRLGCIDLSSTDADAVFIFSDGQNSYGAALPQTGDHYVYCLFSSGGADQAMLESIVGESGGAVIDLYRSTINEAVQIASRAENLMMEVRSASGNSIIEFEEYDGFRGTILVSGVLNGKEDSIRLVYGNNKKISGFQNIPINKSSDCGQSSIDRMQVLTDFDKIIQSQKWEEILYFGKDEKIVTPHTSYLVLERVEDYVRYQIEPPKEIEDECAAMGFVYKDNRSRKNSMTPTTDQILNNVIAHYDARSRMWQNPPTQAKRMIDAENKYVDVSVSRDVAIQNLPATGFELNEVVVTGYSRRQSNTASSVIVHAEEIRGSTTIHQALAGKISGLQVIPKTGNWKQDQNQVRIRGNSSLQNGPLYVLDGIPVSNETIEFLSTNDILTVDVLKDASATAIFGSRGANGVIMIKTKRGSNHYNSSYSEGYRLKDREEVEYMLEMKDASDVELLSRYNDLRSEYGNYAGFFLDASQILFDRGLRKEAMLSLSNAAEVSGGSFIVLRAMAFQLEQWKEFAYAAEIYDQILRSAKGDITTQRNYALCYYRMGEIQKAVDILYDGIIDNHNNLEYNALLLKTLLVSDLSAIIVKHKDQVDLNDIDKKVLKVQAADLRIVIEYNNGIAPVLNIAEPGGAVCTPNRLSANNGFISSNYNGPAEYNIAKAKKGKYKIKVHYQDSYRHYKMPAMARITIYKNFGRKDQSMQVETVMLDNQAGLVEIGEVVWK